MHITLHKLANNFNKGGILELRVDGPISLVPLYSFSLCKTFTWWTTLNTQYDKRMYSIEYAAHVNVPFLFSNRFALLACVSEWFPELECPEITPGTWVVSELENIWKYSKATIPSIECVKIDLFDCRPERFNLYASGQYRHLRVSSS